MLLATVENMEKCKDIPGVVVLDLISDISWSAEPAEYNMWLPNEVIETGSKDNRRKAILAVRVCKWVDPLTGEDIIAQIPAEEK